MSASTLKDAYKFPCQVTYCIHFLQLALACHQLRQLNCEGRSDPLTLYPTSDSFNRFSSVNMKVLTGTWGWTCVRLLDPLIYLMFRSSLGFPASTPAEPWGKVGSTDCGPNPGQVHRFLPIQLSATGAELVISIQTVHDIVSNYKTEQLDTT